ncbi:MAG: FAD-dependent oxidoreductase [Planctomycetia bacterium]|nr:FAD-dependent oxidoreductase [Planctomycetia bacterium]
MTREKVKDAPEIIAMPQNVRFERDADRIATVWFDVQGKSVNAVSSAVMAELDAVVRELEADPPVGVIFASEKPGTFIVGGDLFEIWNADEAGLDAFLARGQQVFDRIAALGVTTVAALSGDTLGGGYELALACRHRIVADVPHSRIGLPETAIGIIPGWGGTLRLPRLVGIEAGLKLLVTGKTLGPQEALQLGMVDEVVPPDRLLDEARRRVLDPKPRPTTMHPAAEEDATACAESCDRSRAETRARSGDHLPAPLRIVDVVEISYREGLAAGADAERRVLIELLRGDAGRNLLRFFFLRSGGKKAAAQRAGGRPRDVKRAAVIGGGTMGAGIALALARTGMDVQVIEADEAASAAASARIAATDGGKKPLVTTDWSTVAMADFIVEAVVESLPVKLDVFRRLDDVVRQDAVLASNTSSLGIAAIAAATRHPERVIGLHFFNPVAKMPLVEVVRAKQSSADAVATGVAIAARAGKIPVVVNDAPGFVVNRVLFPYLREAAAVFDEGAAVDDVDAAVRGWGMPMGPFALLDEIGLDTSLFIFESLAAALGGRFATPPSVARAVACGWLGRKSGRGFYDHPQDGRPTPNSEWPLASGGRVRFPPTDIADRLLKPMMEEARLVLADGVVESADALDLASVLGIGFPAFRGGLATFAGLAESPDRYSSKRPPKEHS